MDLESLFSLTCFVKYIFKKKLEPQHPLINSNFLFREYTFIFNDRCWPLMRSLREYSCINSLHNFFCCSFTHVTFFLKHYTCHFPIDQTQKKNLEFTSTTIYDLLIAKKLGWFWESVLVVWLCTFSPKPFYEGSCFFLKGT